MKNAKLFLLGIDGLPPRVFYKFLSEGRLPTFARLLEKSAIFDVIPTLPALTAPGWLSIASGAFPSTIGVENILLQAQGTTPDAIVNAFDTGHSKVEYLWESFDRQGLCAVVLKYPGSWPPRDGNFVQIDGAGGYADISCSFEALPSCAYVAGLPDSETSETEKLFFPRGYKDHWRIHTGTEGGRVNVVIRDASGWRGLSVRAQPAFEFVVRLTSRAPTAAPVLHALAYSLDGVVFLALSPDKDVSNIDAACLNVGFWSSWIRGENSRGDYQYRFKLIHLDLARRQLHLYRSEAHQTEGFTRPTELAAELMVKAGPIVEWTGTYDLMNNLLDLDTQFELYEQHTVWMAKTIRHLAQKYHWGGFFTHWHVIEYAHHLLGASLYPEHPLHRPEKASRDIEFLGRVYSLADQLLESVLSVLDDRTFLVVASDHGHDLVHSVFYVNHFLRRHNWLNTASSGAVDWSRTKAYALFPGFIYFNVKGKWAEGILNEAELPSLRMAITEALRALVDPRRGTHPIKLVLEREELAAFGQYGDRAADLFFCMDRGYEPASRIRANGHVCEEFETTLPYKEVTSGHGSFSPVSLSARTLALFHGPGIEPGEGSRYPVSILDLAPTMAALVGLEPPSQCEGRKLPLRFKR